MANETAPVETATPATETVATPPSDDVIAEGMLKAMENPSPEPTMPKPEPKAEALKAEPAKFEPEKVEPAKVEAVDPSKVAADAAKAEQDAAVLTEAKNLGLKEGSKATERFKALSADSRELHDLKPKYTELETLAKTAEARVAQWEDTVTSTGCTPQQFGEHLTFMQLENSGDPVKMRKAFDALNVKLADLGRKLAIEAPGVDPLEAYPDLKAKVEAGTIEREDALETATLRRTRDMATTRTTQTEQASRQQDEQKRAVDAGVAAVEALNVQLRAADPHFAERWPLLAPMVKLICDGFPPAQWAGRIAAAHAALPAYVAPVAAVVPKPPVTPVLRTNGATSAQRIPKDGAEAFLMGAGMANA